ncbi:MAG TPA: hypothetical protein DCZ95_05920 [Verrucomicrobia bacterium]|nr:MAG: hypothetical protein A2X46_09800 [Lentisphaerae bacterium GWF2_57_35]HBA83615.1 hypothetical protein [Verrucomicrobiota bacterium]
MTLKAAGALLLLFLAAEFARLFLLFYRLNHLAGYAFLAVLAGLFAALLLAGLFSSRAPEPMTRPDFATASHHELVNYCRYLSRRLVYLGNNPLFDREGRHAVAEVVSYIRDMLRAHPLRDDLQRTIVTMEHERFPELLASLKEKADWEIQSAVLQAMKDSSCVHTEDNSPWNLNTRQLSLIIRLTDQLAGVSRLRERLGFAIDAFRLAWTTHRSDWRQRLQNHLILSRALPRRCALDLADMLWSGWRIMFTGRIAVDRCLHIGLWTPEEALTRLNAQIEEMEVQIRTLFLTHVFNETKPLLRPDPLPESFDEGVYWNAASHAIKTALGAAVAANRKEPTSSSTEKTTIQPEPERDLADSNGRLMKHRHRRRSHKPAILRIAETFGQRIKYGLLSRRLYK